MLKASQTLMSGRSIGTATGGLFLFQDAVDVRVRQGGQHPARRRPRHRKLATPTSARSRRSQGARPQTLFHKPGDEILQLHAVESGPGLRLAEQFVGEVYRGPHVRIFMLLCEPVKSSGPVGMDRMQSVTTTCPLRPWPSREQTASGVR